MRYVLVFTLLLAGCSNEAAEKAADKEVKEAEAASTVELGEASGMDISTADLAIPDQATVDAEALKQIKTKLECQECGLERMESSAEAKTVQYNVDCDEIKYIVTYNPETKEVVESKPVVKE